MITDATHYNESVRQQRDVIDSFLGIKEFNESIERDGWKSSRRQQLRPVFEKAASLDMEKVTYEELRNIYTDVFTYWSVGGCRKDEYSVFDRIRSKYFQLKEERKSLDL